jgi:hypothetical protein
MNGILAASLTAAIACELDQPASQPGADAGIVAAGGEAGQGGRGGASGSGGSSAGVAGAAGEGGAGAMPEGGSAPDVVAEASEAGEAGLADVTQDETASTDASTCAGLFCEDFERGMVDTARWNTQVMGGATFMIQRDTAAHGQYAAQFHGLPTPTGGASNAYAYLLTKAAPTALATHNFGRAYFKIAPQSHSINLGLVFGGTAGFPKPTYMSIAGHSGGWQLGFIKLSGSPTGEVQAYPPAPMPATWMCLEWEFNDEPDQLSLWVDGKTVGSLDPNHLDYPPGHVPGAPLYNGMSSGLVGSFTDFGFGFYDWHPSGTTAFDVFYDDIVLDTKRVGCL